MDIKEEIREITVIHFLARDEECSIVDATDLWSTWKKVLEDNPAHMGGCISEPNTCNRCHVEKYYRDADALLKAQSSKGVMIATIEEGALIEGSGRIYPLIEER